ncbi:hypothetical protein KSP40_PGU012639 [Platanthera guangdongensis]|uniref:Uncharacterized protein n=1 Tax=Platanthera guangdongensis TaxID=2320717 RepID=A0ABR2LE74_9ASPA
MDDDDETHLPFPCLIAVAEADVWEPPGPALSEKEDGRSWGTVADSYANCSIFPPNLHEGLHPRPDLYQTLALPHIPHHQTDAAAALYFPKRDKGEEESSTVSKPSLISPQRMLSSWLNPIRSKISDRFGGSAEIVGVGVCAFVALAGFVIYSRRRHRLEKEFLLFSIQEKNQKIGKLLHQVAELNAILAAHRRVPVLRKT